MSSPAAITGVFAGVAALYPPFVVATADGGNPWWLHLGVAGAALYLVYMILKPLVTSQVEANKREAKAQESVAASMVEIAKAVAAGNEIQRQLRDQGLAGAEAHAAQAQALRDISSRIRCPLHGE